MADVLKPNSKQLASRFKAKVVAVRMALFFMTCFHPVHAAKTILVQTSAESNHSTVTFPLQVTNVNCHKHRGLLGSVEDIRFNKHFTDNNATHSALGLGSDRHQHILAQYLNPNSTRVSKTYPAVNDSIPYWMLPPSTIDISQCIIANSTLNITAEDKITILSYIQHNKHALNNPGIESLSNSRYEQDSTPAQEENSFAASAISQVFPNKANTPSITAGRCSLNIKGPRGKIFSILFLNQTCSQKNEVRVTDIHKGNSSERTTLNGCSLWKSPGYDVTTSNRTALIVVDLRDLIRFYKLEISIVPLAPPRKNGLLTRYVSPALGYVQTLGWYSFAMTFSTISDDVSTIKVPSNHSTLISVVYAHMAAAKAVEIPSVELLKMNSQRQKEAQKVWCTNKNTKTRPDVQLLSDVTQFELRAKKAVGAFFGGIRILFSFHEPLSTPRRNPDLRWNCSVPFWPGFRPHFLCNNKTECAGHEDEEWCPDISCGKEGIQLDNTCYVFLSLPEDSSWHHARKACRKKGATLASFPTRADWYHFALLVQAKNVMDSIYFGLRSKDVSFPHMYRYLRQWDGGSIAHYYYYSTAVPPPACGLFWFNRLFLFSCGQIFPDSRIHALCQITTPSPVNVNKTSGAETEASSAYAPIKTPILKAQLRSADSWKHAPISSIACPKQHRAHDFLACDARSSCWLGIDVIPVPGDAAESRAVICSASEGVVINNVTSNAMFPCQNGAQFVSYSLVCDHLQDCADNSDENFCVFPSCSAGNQSKCTNGQCVQFHNRCDGLVQCVDESDEADCVIEYIFLDREQPQPPLLVNFDGRGSIQYDTLAITAGDGYSAGVRCPDTHVYCPSDDSCLPVFVRCNKVIDCSDHQDEVGCNSYTCPGFYRCYGSSEICLHPDHLCDGWAQCSQHDDERFCNLTCPASCTCLGYAFTCTSDFQVNLFSALRYLDASGTGLKPERLAKNNILVYLRLVRCDLEHLGSPYLPNLVSLDLSDNLFSTVYTSELNLLKNLQNISLARNPLSELFSGNFSPSEVFANVLHVDLTGVQLETLDVRSSLPFPKLLSLNLSKTGLKRLTGDGFMSMPSLDTVDLRNCPITEFPRSVFKGLKDLRHVFADNYKLCCEATLPDGFNLNNCRAPFNELSSCEALLRSDFYRVCLSVLAAMAVSGNLGCFCLRVFSLAGRGKTGFNVFVTHLCVSDFVMGVFLVMIGSADRLYLGRYLWEDSRWRHSVACQVAGSLAFLSSEVSALIICLITLDRFLVIRFPFSRLRFSPLSAQVTSTLTWTAGVMVVTVPLMPETSNWKFYSQTGICIPLPITTKDFGGHDYAFNVMIILNLVVFLVIAVGQISVYLSMTSNAMSSIDTTRKSRDLIVARRLLTVVLSDFLCWFPLGLLGMLAAQGVPVPGEFNVSMAIFVLPLNSALNPFLYTLNMVQEKRRRVTEEKLLKMITDFRADESG